MLGWITARSQRRALASELYGSIVAAGRSPHLYLALGVPDTPEGRYEMIALHMVLVIERLRTEGTDGEALSRLLVERFVVDMDDAMREFGVGDLSVPRKVKRAAVGLYERAADLRQPLEGGDGPSVSAAIGRRLPAAPETTRDGLAEHLIGWRRQLAGWPTAALFEGRLPPAAIDPRVEP